MPVESPPLPVLQEVADFLAGRPTPDEILDFRPSSAAQERARELLARSNAGELTLEEDQELAQFDQIERLMRLLKARIRAQSRP